MSLKICNQLCSLDTNSSRLWRYYRYKMFLEIIQTCWFRLRGQVHLASYSPLDAAQSDIEKSFSLHPSVQTALLAAQILIYKNEFTQALKMYQIGMSSIVCAPHRPYENATIEF